MKKPTTRARKPAGFMRQVLALNVARLLERHYKDLPNLTARQRALAKDCGIAFSTVQRLMKLQTGATVENIENIAGAFHMSAYQLLVPALDVANPQVIQGATEAEQRLYRLYKMHKLMPEPVN
jgi:transcriptional regulator with XRE-family HTH domain